MKKSNKHTRTLFAIIIMLFIFVGCKKDKINYSRIFSISFIYNYYNSSPDSIAVNFTTADYPDDLEVVINNQSIENFVEMNNNTYTADIDIAYSKTIYYKINGDKETQEGNIEIPLAINKVFCSGDTVNAYELTEIQPSSIYRFTWEDIDCDYYNIVAEIGTASIDQTQTANNFEIDNTVVGDTNLFSFKINCINGVMYSSESSPCDSGAYGLGYISAKTVNKFNIKLSE